MNLMYYYLKDNDIIKLGDECTGYDLGYWINCDGSVGRTVKDASNSVPNWRVRRLIKTTKLGNTL